MKPRRVDPTSWTMPAGRPSSPTPGSPTESSTSFRTRTSQTPEAEQTPPAHPRTEPRNLLPLRTQTQFPRRQCLRPKSTVLPRPVFPRNRSRTSWLRPRHRTLLQLPPPPALLPQPRSSRALRRALLPPPQPTHEKLHPVLQLPQQPLRRRRRHPRQHRCQRQQRQAAA